MTDPASPGKIPDPPQPPATGTSSTDSSSDDFAASIAAAQPYDTNVTSGNSAERDEADTAESAL